MKHFNHFNHSFENAVFTETRTGKTKVEHVWRHREYLKLLVLHLRLQPYFNDHFMREDSNETLQRR